MAPIKSNTINKIIKPKTHKGKRFLQNREPKLIEDTKNTIFIRGTTANDRCIRLMKDLVRDVKASLKRLNSTFLNKKNDFKPFEDTTPLEFLTSKNDSPLFAFASHNKKRPNNLIIGRTYDDHILDMVEFGADNYIGISEFKVPKISVGTKPIILFSGEPFDVEFEYQRIRNLLLDFFCGPHIESVRLTGLEHAIHFIAADGKIFMRSYKTIMKNSGTKYPRIELEEIGPRVDFTIRRTRLASDDLFKRATQMPKQLKKKKDKNIKKDLLGSTLGRIHMQRQDYKKLQTRKLKGLKKSPKDVDKDDNRGKKRSVVPIEDNETHGNDSVEQNTNVQKKRVRFSL